MSDVAVEPEPTSPDRTDETEVLLRVRDLTKHFPIMKGSSAAGSAR